MSNPIELAQTTEFRKARLPKLNSMKTLTKGSFSTIVNPFKLPSDEEIFLTKKIGKNKIGDQKEKITMFKIWDKKTATNKSSLKRINHNDFVSSENFGSKTILNVPDKSS